ncbi:ABC transporter permease [Asanoa sp. NPDC049573]|uniref:ABC transporter permease n=1 Tax=Asanoa sp. NPDC049573 TaxID=3155396 RepID=UPI003413AB2E
MTTSPVGGRVHHACPRDVPGLVDRSRMFGLILRALATRRAPSLTLFLLTVLSAGAAAAAPQYIAATTRDLATASAEAAPVSDRTATLRRGVDQADLRADVISSAEQEVRDAFALPDLSVHGSLLVNGAALRGDEIATVLLVNRTGFCAEVVLDGSCPARPGEVAVNEVTARQLGVGPGDPIEYHAPGFDRYPLTVSAVYRVKDPNGDYWAGGGLLKVDGQATTAPLLTTPETIVAAKPQSTTLLVDAVAGRDVFSRSAPLTVRDHLVGGQRLLGERGYEPQVPLRVLAVVIYNSQLDIVYAVPISLVELLAFCWIALFLAVRHGALERHRDVGLLKLRGASRSRILSLTLGQSAVPMLAGGVVGLALAIPLRAGSGIAKTSATTTDLLSVGAALLAVVGAILAAAVAERRALGAPVALLMRAVPPRHTGWRYGAVDAVLVILALAGAYEARAYASRPPSEVAAAAGAAPQSTWLALLAPALLALALGVVLARVLVPIAAKVGRRALRAGRLGVAFTATELARRPAVPRLTALLTAAVTLFCVAVTTSDTTNRLGAERASTEIGADRVLLVTASSRARLLAATRAVDPDGRFAMAVVESPNLGVLAVDATRLAAVARWRGDYGGTDPGRIAARLRPRAPAPLTVTGTELTLAATGLRGRTKVEALLQGTDGGTVTVEFGTVTAGSKDYHQRAPGCAAGCRLVSFRLTGLTKVPQRVVAPDAPPPPPDRPTPDAVRLTELRGASGGVDTATFADRSRWRTAVAAGPPPPEVTTTAGGLVVTPGPVGQVDPSVFVDDSPDRLPAVAAGVRGLEFAAGDPHVVAFPGAQVPVDVTAEATALPRVGRDAVLVDLETADLLSGDLGGGESLQVWATDDAPADLAARLASQGVDTFSTGTVAALTDRYSRQAPPSTVRFQLLAAALMVLLAAGALGVIVAVERRPRAAELTALRRQGLTARAVTRATLGGYLVVSAAALVAGVLAALPARTVLAAPLKVFADGWDVLPPPAAVRAVPLLLAMAAAAVVYALVVLLASGLPRRNGGEQS